jgi:hypothetical protein
MPPGAYEQIVTRPAGSGTSTAADMARFMIAQLQQGRFGEAKLLRPETAAVMHSASSEELPGFSAMAHGFFLATNNGRRVIGHGGDTVWFHTEMNLLPDEGVGIFYSFNSRGRDSAVYEARFELFEGFMDRYFPEAAEAAFPAAPASAAADAREIAGGYESSRRVEHGFLSIFYLLQQVEISANADGTITAPEFLSPGPARFREIGPQLWRQVDGSRQLALRTIGGVKTVIDSEDPTSVLQAVPFARSAGLNLSVLLSASIILVLTVAAWLLTPVWRAFGWRRDAAPPEVRRPWLSLRFAAAFVVLYLVAWLLLLSPLMSVRLEVYQDSLDPVVRTLQVAGLLVIAVAILGVWSAWRLRRASQPIATRAWAFLVAASLLGIVWIAVMGGLLRFSLNY